MIAEEIVADSPPFPGNYEEVAFEKLPKGVTPYNPEDGYDPALPQRPVRIKKVTLQGTKLHFLIAYTSYGGTGGSYFFVYRLVHHDYDEVLSGQGGIGPGPKKGQIECISSGGGMYRRTVYRFDRSRFVPVFNEVLKIREDDRYDVLEHHQGDSDY